MKYEVVEPPQFPAIARELEQSRGLFFDTETTVEDLMFQHELLGFAVSRGEPDAPVYYIPVNHHQYRLTDLDLKLILDVMSEKPLYNQNIKFDLHVLAKHGLRVKRGSYQDLMPMSRLWYKDEHPDLGLDKVAWNLLHYRYEHNLKSARKNLQEFSVEEVAAYCSEDVWVARKVYYWLKANLSTKLLRLYQRESMLTRDLFDSEEWGMYINEGYLAQVAELLDEKKAEALAQVCEMNELEEFNPRSAPQVNALFDKHHIPVVKRTKTGAPSWDKDAIQDVRRRRAFREVGDVGRWTLQNVAVYRVLAYIRSGLVERAIRYLQAGSPTFHGEFKNWGTVTGRLSSDTQQMVKGWLQLRPDAAPNDPITYWDEDGPDMKISGRRCFGPRPGYFLLRPDYSQIEMWVLGYFMKDPVFNRWLESGDVHAAAAKEVWGIGPEHELAKRYRARGKEFNFSCVYGVGDYTLSKRLNVKREEAQQFRQEYNQHMPGYNKLYNSIYRQLRDEGIIKNVYGREYMLDPQLAYKGVNYITQGSAGDFVKFRLPATRELRRQMGVKTANTTHDDFFFEVPFESVGGVPDLVAALRPSPFGRELDIDVDWSLESYVDLRPWDKNTEAELAKAA